GHLADAGHARGPSPVLRRGPGARPGPPPAAVIRGEGRRAALGLDLFGENLEQAWAVTAVQAPEGIDGNELVAKVRKDHRIILAPGQGPLKGKVFRIGHLGYYDRFDIVRCLAALELTLEAMGYPVKRGAAVGAAEDVFATADRRGQD